MAGRSRLAEVFGYPVEDLSGEAGLARGNRLCPFNNKGPKCTKDSIINPLGVCAVAEGGMVTVTCPVRFRQDWLIAVDAASFFFPGHAIWSAIPEVRLVDKQGQAAGNLDLVIVAQDAMGQILDFGAVEVQSVYISGNVRRPFQEYIADPPKYLSAKDVSGYFRPDFLSSSRKRLAPQLIYKGGILKAWGKRLAVVVQSRFFQTLPSLPVVSHYNDADIAWMLYDLRRDPVSGRFNLVHEGNVLTDLHEALSRLVTAEAGPVEDFISSLQRTLGEKRVKGASQMGLGQVTRTSNEEPVE